MASSATADVNPPLSMSVVLRMVLSAMSTLLGCQLLMMMIAGLGAVSESPKPAGSFPKRNDMAGQSSACLSPPTITTKNQSPEVTRAKI